MATRFHSLPLRVKLARTPPFLMLAVTEKSRGKKKRGSAKPPYRFRRLSLAEMMQRTGFSRDKVKRVARMTDWRSLTVPDMLTWMEACDADVTHSKHLRHRIKRLMSRRMPHLSEQQGRSFWPMVMRWTKPTPTEPVPLPPGD